jgi:hypothetical protein
MGRAAQQSLFLTNTYNVDSGGDPVVIPQLTFDKFKQFHNSYYHPSNSRIYFYGDDDPTKRLELIDEYLSEFERIPISSKIDYQPKTLNPSIKKVKYPVAPNESTKAKHMITVNWLLNDQPVSMKDSLALGILDHLLLGTSSAVLRKRLTESQVILIYMTSIEFVISSNF